MNDSKPTYADKNLLYWKVLHFHDEVEPLYSQEWRVTQAQVYPCDYGVELVERWFNSRYYSHTYEVGDRYKTFQEAKYALYDLLLNEPTEQPQQQQPFQDPTQVENIRASDRQLRQTEDKSRINTARRRSNRRPGN